MSRLSSFCALVLLLCLIVASSSATGFGDRLLRTFLLFKNQPLTAQDAQSNGWTAINGSSTCIPQRGIPYTNTDDGPTSYNPTILYFTPRGQLSGFGIRVWGEMSPILIKAGLLATVSNGVYDIFLTTRDPASICSNNQYSETVGDQIHINGFFPVPLNDSFAIKAGWVPGNCINRMGAHYAYDLAAPGNQTWNAASQLPILPMYDAKRHTINAILFNVWSWQTTEPLGVFEGPFTSSFYCFNWCADSGCHWPGVTVWTTLHWHFVDPDSISCDGAACVF